MCALVTAWSAGDGPGPGLIHPTYLYAQSETRDHQEGAYEARQELAGRGSRGDDGDARTDGPAPRSVCACRSAPRGEASRQHEPQRARQGSAGAPAPARRRCDRVARPWLLAASGCHSGTELRLVRLIGFVPPTGGFPAGSSGPGAISTRFASHERATLHHTTRPPQEPATGARPLARGDRNVGGHEEPLGVRRVPRVLAADPPRWVPPLSAVDTS